MYLVYTKSNFPCHFVAINTLISLWYISFVYNMFCVLSLSQGWDKAHDIGYALVYSINIILYLSAPGLDGVNRQMIFMMLNSTHNSQNCFAKFKEYHVNGKQKNLQSRNKNCINSDVV